MQARSSSLDFRSLFEQIHGIEQSISRDYAYHRTFFDFENRVAHVRLRQELERHATAAPKEKLTAENVKSFCKLLAERAAVIKNTDLDYTIAPNNPVNVMYLALAQELESVCGKSRYELLMPSIEVTMNEVTTTDLKDNSLELRHFIKSDDNKRFIEVYACLEAAESDGILKHTSLFHGEVKKLSDSEAARIINHSKEVKDYYTAITARFNAKTKGASFGAALTRLAEDLRNGGRRRADAEERRRQQRYWEEQRHGARAHLQPFEQRQANERQHNDGLRAVDVETNAMRNANEGIYFFAEWLHSLNVADRSKLLGCRSYHGSVRMNEIWERLARPEKTDYRDTVYCVDGLSDFIDVILKDNHWLFDAYPENSETTRLTSIAQLDHGVNETRKQFVEAIRGNDYQVTASYGKEQSIETLCRQCGPMIDSEEVLRSCLSCLNTPQTKLLFASMKVNLTRIIFDQKSYRNFMSNIYQEYHEVLHACLAEQWSKVINDKNELISLLSWYPAQYQAGLIKAVAPRLGDLFSTSGQFISALSILPRQSKLNLLENAESLLLNILNTGNDYMAFVGMIGHEFAELTAKKVMSRLPEMIVDFNQLRTITRMLSGAEATQEELLTRMGSRLAQLITTSEQLESIIFKKDVKANTVLIQQLGAAAAGLISAPHQFLHMLDHTNASAHKEIFRHKGQQIKDLITCKEEFDHVLATIDNSSNIVTLGRLLGEDLLKYLPTVNDLVLFIMKHPVGDRFVPVEILGNRLASIIVSAEHLNLVLSVIPEKNIPALLQLFDEQIPQFVQQGSHLIDLLKWQPAGEKRVAFIERLNDRLPQLIENGDQLAAVLKLLPKDYHETLLKRLNEQLPATIKDHAQFANIAEQLEDNLQVALLDRLESHVLNFTSTAEQLFVMFKPLTVANRFALADYLVEKDSLAQTVQTHVQFVAFLKHFADEDMRWNFIQYFAKKSPELRQYVKTDHGLIQVLDLLKEKHADLIRLMGEYLASFIHTRKQFDNVQQQLSVENLGLLMKTLGDHFPVIYRQTDALPLNLFRKPANAQTKQKPAGEEKAVSQPPKISGTGLFAVRPESPERTQANVEPVITNHGPRN